MLMLAVSEFLVLHGLGGQKTDPTLRYTYYNRTYNPCILPVIGCDKASKAGSAGVVAYIFFLLIS